MKRCPQCEFIYDDDQSLCDMDGVLLVFDSRNLPNPHALATLPDKPPQPRRNRAVPAFATLILALVLGMVYYVSTQRRATPPVIDTLAPSAATASIPVPEVSPTPESRPAEVSQVPPAEEPKPAPTKQSATAPVKKATVKTANTAAPAAEPKKDDSKVGSFFKKTGRILKKPFKF